MGGKRIYLAGVLALFLTLVTLGTAGQYASAAQPSTLVTLTCTGSPCPWGASVSGHAIVWPASMSPSNVRLGYSASAGAYLPGASAIGTSINVATGSATVFAGLPGVVSHRVLATLSAGQTYLVTGLGTGEVVTVQSAQAFSHTVTPPPPPPPPPPGSTASSLVTLTCTGSPCPWGSSLSGHAVVWPESMSPSTVRLGYSSSAGAYLPATTAPGTQVAVSTGTARVLAGLPSVESHRTLATLTAGQSYVVTGLAANEVVSVQSASAFSYVVTPPLPPPPPPEGWTASSAVTLTCTGSPCPYGPSASGHAIVWPASMSPSTARLGYTASAGAYLPASSASGVTIAINSSPATVFAGLPTVGSHRVLATLSAGQSYVVSGLAAGEVVSVQSSQPFAYVAAPPTEPPPPPEEPCPDPLTCEPVTLAETNWRCNIPGCTDPDWVGGAVSWPSWSAYQTNNRTGVHSRTAFTAAGADAYPYMGAWAEGCEVTAVSGLVIVVEWQRGTDVYRSTLLNPGQSHTIDLISPEDGALVEGTINAQAALENCNPQPI